MTTIEKRLCLISYEMRELELGKKSSNTVFRNIKDWIIVDAEQIENWYNAYFDKEEKP